MTSFEDPAKGLGDRVDIEVGPDVVVESVVESRRAPLARRSQLAGLPLLLGVIYLLVNIFILVRLPSVFGLSAVGKNVNSTISLLFLLASIVTCLVLIVLGIAARRDESIGQGSGRYMRTLALPILLGLLAPLLTIWSLHVSKSSSERFAESTKPCIEVYEKAAAIAKDNPRFRMPPTDRDEVRCTVNAVLGR
jgi:hypothetical protein